MSPLQETSTRFDRSERPSPPLKNWSSTFSMAMTSRMYVLLLPRHCLRSRWLKLFLFYRSGVSDRVSGLGLTRSWVMKKFVGQNRICNHMRSTDTRRPGTFYDDFSGFGKGDGHQETPGYSRDRVRHLSPSSRILSVLMPTVGKKLPGLCTMPGVIVSRDST